MARWSTLSFGELRYNKKEKIYYWQMFITYGNSREPNIINIQAKKGKIVSVNVNAYFRYRKNTLEETIEINKQEFQETYQQELLDIIEISENIKQASGLIIENLTLEQRGEYIVGYFSIKGITEKVSMLVSPKWETISFSPKTIDFSEDVAYILKETLFNHHSFRLKLLPYKHYKTIA